MKKENFKQKAMLHLDWLKENQSHLESELAFLRLILQRRVLWLRQLWKHDPLQNFQGQVISDVRADWLLTGENHAAEQKFYKENSIAKKITKGIEDLKKKLEEQSFALLKAGAPTALDVISQIFDLTSFDRAVLLLCLAPELDPAFERLYAYVQDDLTRKYVTLHLALSLFAADPDTELILRQSFLPGAPLFKFKLIEQKDSAQTAHNPASCPLKIDPRIADYLQGINRLDERIADVLKPMPSFEFLPHPYEEIIHRFQYLIEKKDRNSPLPSLNFIGSTISGKKIVASKLCELLGIKLYALDPKRLHSNGLRWHDLMILLEREFLLLHAALYIDNSELKDENDPAKPFLDELIEELRTFFIVGSQESLRCERELLLISVPKLDAKEQAIVWKQQLAKQGINLDGQIDKVVEQFDFEPDMISPTIALAVNNTQMRPESSSSLTLDDIWMACREKSQHGLNDRVQRIFPCYSWEDIVLPKDSLEQLKDIAAQVAHRALVYEKWGFGTKMSRGRGISALFSGPSGTGKTMAAEILANHLKLSLYRIDLSGVVSKYIGETEKNLRQVFNCAEQSGAILFFDEADALFGKRSEVKDSHDRYANIEINYLLQRMEDYRGLAILATNMKSLLDQAFLRRLRFHVEFPFPNVFSRKKIWQKSFPADTPLGNIDYNFLAKLEIPGGNIRNIALNASFLAADNGQSVEMHHILRATKREYEKIDKLVLESEFGHYYHEINQT